MSKRHANVTAALDIITALGFERAQRNERSALCLLALADLKPSNTWADAQRPLIGITPMMDFARQHYSKAYAPNSRETFRRQTMHQFVEAGFALYNPDSPSRAVNSPNAVYQLSPEALDLVRVFGSAAWSGCLGNYLSQKGTLATKYAKARDLRQLGIVIRSGFEIRISAGEHSALIKAVLEEFAPRFAPGANVLYVGDTGEKFSYFDSDLAEKLSANVDPHGKMPDVAIYDAQRDWLLLVEAVTSHGPVDGKRREELTRLFSGINSGVVYVTAFPTRAMMARYLPQIAWETEVWIADAPSHLIHFNGTRFLGPYDPKSGE